MGAALVLDSPGTEYLSSYLKRVDSTPAFGLLSQYTCAGSSQAYDLVAVASDAYTGLLMRALVQQQADAFTDFEIQEADDIHRTALRRQKVVEEVARGLAPCASAARCVLEQGCHNSSLWIHQLPGLAGKEQTR